MQLKTLISRIQTYSTARQPGAAGATRLHLAAAVLDCQNGCLLVSSSTSTWMPAYVKRFQEVMLTVWVVSNPHVDMLSDTYAVHKLRCMQLLASRTAGSCLSLLSRSEAVLR